MFVVQLFCSFRIYKNMAFLFALILILAQGGLAQQNFNAFTVYRIKYNGGGDWYGNKTTFVNLFKLMTSELHINTQQREVSGSLMDDDLFSCPTAYIAGHGNISFNEAEAERLRLYLTSGGFLFADDDYGMDKSFRREMKKVFPELKFVELPFNHPIYHLHYNFPNGLPKIHEHDGGPPHGFGLIYEGRLVVFYSLNTDISDGCEDADIHHDPPEKRREALKMGLNILLYSLLY
jgi:hypothetical protein